MTLSLLGTVESLHLALGRQLLSFDITNLEASCLNSLGPKFSSEGHFHSLQLLNVPQFLFSQLVRLKTTPRDNFSRA